LSAAELHEQNRNESGGPMGDSLEGATESVARTLSQARQAYGQDLRSVAEALRIRYVYLDAIESGRFQDLPGPAYAIGFVRTYSEFLGLDSNEIVARFKKEVDGLDGQTQLHFLAPAPESRIPGGAVLLICGLIAVLAYGGWYYLSHRDTDVADLIPKVPERMQALIGSEESADKVPDQGEDVAMTSESAAPMVGDSSEPATPAEFKEQAVAEPTDAAAIPETVPSAEGEEDSTAMAIGEELTASANSPAETDNAETTVEGAPPPTPASDSPSDGAVDPVAPSEPAVTVADSAPDATEEEPSVAAEAEQSNAVSAASTEATQDEIMPEGVSEAEGGSAADSGTALAEDQTAPPSSETVSGLEDTQAALPEQSETRAEATVSPNATRFPQVIDSSPGIPVAPEVSEDSAFLSEHEPIVYGEDNGDFRVRLVAAQDCWVQVRDDEGKLLLTRVLRAGDSYQVPNKKGLTLLTGNAGGLYIEVDGARLPVLGPVGVVRRDVSLDPERLLGGGTASLQ